MVITPNNQWVGLFCPEDRPKILERYKLFGLKPEQARSFNFIYHGVGQGIGQPLPKDLRQLASGLRVVSFKDSDDQRRCEITADILRSLFDACSRSESSKPRVIVVIDETHRFMKKHVGKKVEAAAGETEKAIELVTREGLKYGLQLVILSQTIRDFSYSLGAVRQNIATRIFMRNSDREIDYASEYLDDGSEIVRLKTAEAFCCNSEWGVTRISVRPPLSKVWEPFDAEVRKLVESAAKTQPTLSIEAQAVLDMVDQQYHQTGEPAKLAFITKQLGITSRRKIERIINELKKASAAKFERLDKQGKPLVIVPSGAHKQYIKADTKAHKGDT
ncbi:MAG: ATP-binding protein [Candidatus Bathyarchaeota archaeon]|nr:MAG: ATP-binding protein [Candidatus Bathyarchaeota archaeon]